MSIHFIRFTNHLITGVVVMTIFVGCESSSDTVTAPQVQETKRVIVFDSGLGTGQYDKMTYAEYKSEIALTPQTDIMVSAIRPQIWYCNGTSGYLAFIRGEHFEWLAASAGLVDGNGYMTPIFSDRQLDQAYTLKADSTYLIVMSVWTTKSVGIFTTGSRTVGIEGAGHYETHYARSNTADHLDRGGIAFQLIQ